LKTVWSKLGSQSPHWLSVELDILIEPPHTVIVIEAGALEWKHGEIALSKTELLKTPCKGMSLDFFTFNYISKYEHFT